MEIVSSMGKVEEIAVVKLINEVPDRDCNTILIEKTPHNYHVHFRNLKIELSEGEIEQWREAFVQAREKVLKGGYFNDDTV